MESAFRWCCWSFFLFAAAALGISPHYCQDWLIAAGAMLWRRWSPPGADESVGSADVQV
jgi:hypothetical protein